MSQSVSSLGNLKNEKNGGYLRGQKPWLVTENRENGAAGAENSGERIEMFKKGL